MHNNTAQLKAPNDAKKILLHSCCAPCSGGIITMLMRSGITPTVLFYNPNIHPKEEYLKRKQALTLFLERINIPFIDADYDPKAWFDRMQGLEEEPQRGKRCLECFAMRLEYAAKLAKKQEFAVFSSTFGISRWKDIEQVNIQGEKTAKKFSVIYWDHNWRKQGGQDLMHEVARQEQFYQQTYCGCEYSK